MVFFNFKFFNKSYFLVAPGFSCANGEICLGDSICKNYVCACPPGMNVVNDHCVVLNNAFTNTITNNNLKNENANILTIKKNFAKMSENAKQNTRKRRNAFLL